MSVSELVEQLPDALKIDDYGHDGGDSVVKIALGGNAKTLKVFQNPSMNGRGEYAAVGKAAGDIAIGLKAAGFPDAESTPRKMKQEGESTHYLFRLNPDDTKFKVKVASSLAAVRGLRLLRQLGNNEYSRFVYGNGEGQGKGEFTRPILDLNGNVTMSISVYEMPQGQEMPKNGKELFAKLIDALKTKTGLTEKDLDKALQFGSNFVYVTLPPEALIKMKKGQFREHVGSDGGRDNRSSGIAGTGGF
jgi:hypothetical protein